jgi:DNA-binding transcriptional regulator of glucitol operon
MDRNDWLILILVVWACFFTAFALKEIWNFQPVLESCQDDFAIIEKCHCIPCSWNQSKYYDNESCFFITPKNGS